MKNRCMKNGMMIIVAVLLVAMAFAGAGAADVPAEMNGKNWMSYIPDSTSLGEINIPGTHDSGMWDCAEPIAGIFSITQNAGHNVMAQFDDGCRWFDMRYDTVKDKTDWTIGETSSTKDVHVTHGGFRSVWERHGLIVTETLLFTHVVNNLLYSCYSNNECVVITLQCEKGNDEYAKNVVKDTVNSLCTNNPDMFIQLKNGDPLPALGDVRGKIIFIHSGQYSKTHDHYQVDEKNPADVKWNELVTHWNTINKTQNYTESHTLSNGGGYRDFPIVAFTSYYSWREGSIPSGKMNERIWNDDYIFNQGNYYGVVLYNFVDSTVARKIYASNNFIKRVAKPVPGTTLFTYSGTEYQPIQPGTGYTLSGDVKGTKPGKYVVTVSVNASEGYLWKDGSNKPLTYNWEILTREVRHPELNQSSYDYDGSFHSVELTATGDESYYTSTGTFTANNSGTYTVIVSLKDKSNTSQDTIGSSEDLILLWSIIPGTISSGVPELTQSRFFYNGSDITVELTNTSAEYHLAENMTATGVGTYLAKVDLKDPANKKWSDGTNKSVYLPWLILPRNITAPDKLVVNEFIYNGSLQQVVLNTTKPEEASNYSIIRGGSATGVGTYNAVVNLTDRRNNSWVADDLISRKLPRVYVWNITPFEETIPEINAPTTFVYDGSSHTVSLSPSAGNFTATGNFSETDVGVYRIEVGLNDTVNYTWTDKTIINRTYDWMITPKQITRPTVTNLIHIENGSPKSVIINPAPGADYTAENASATDAGLYVAVISLRDKNNTVWSDTKDTQDIETEWLIRNDTVTIKYVSSDPSLGNVSPASETIYLSPTNRSVGSVANASGDNVFLYWNRSTPFQNKSEIVVSLNREMVPRAFGVYEGVINYLPTTYTAVFGSNTFTGTRLGNSTQFFFKEHEGTLVSRDSGITESINLRIMTGVDAVTVTRNNSSISNPPTSAGHSSQLLSIFSIDATKNASVGTMTFGISIDFADANTANAYANNVRFWHYNGTNGAWDAAPMTSRLGNVVGSTAGYVVSADSLSPIGITIETPNPSYSGGGSSSKNYGGSMWAQNPNPTAAPTAVPTVAPTSAPVYDTPTSKPTTQPTQKSPAPFVGLIAGLGIATLVFRLRK